MDNKWCVDEIICRELNLWKVESDKPSGFSFIIYRPYGVLDSNYKFSQFVYIVKWLYDFSMIDGLISFAKCKERVLPSLFSVKK